MRFLFLLLFIGSVIPCPGYAFSVPGSNIAIIDGRLYVNGVFVPKTEFVDPDIVLRAIVEGKNAASKWSPNVENRIYIQGSEITESGHIRKKRFSGIDATDYYAVKKFRIKDSDGSSGLGVTSERSGYIRVNNNVVIKNSRVDAYEENLGTKVDSKRLVRGRIDNNVHVEKSKIGAR